MTISRRAGTALICAAGATLVLVAVAVVDGRPVVEKIALRLLTPVGLLWLGLAGQSLVMFVRRRRAAGVWSLGLWLTLTLLGHGPLIERAFARVEQPFMHQDVLREPPYDVLIVLGGGATGGGPGRPQLNQAGDRIVLTAQLYHAGQVRRIICTGQQIAAINPDDLDPAEQSAQILRSLGVPAVVITQSGGANTAEEMQRIADGGDAAGRVGLVTSAWHMPRALRLAKRHNLQPEPVPADFQGTPPDAVRKSGFGAMVLNAIPSAETLAAAARLAKEMLAFAVGR